MSYWASWYTDYTIKNIIVVTLCWGILKLWILKQSNGYLIWVFIFLYGQSIFGFILISQAVFSNARYASIITTLIYFGLSLINNSVNHDYSRRQQALVAGSFSPAILMIQSTMQIIRFESEGSGINFENWHIPIGRVDVKISVQIFACQSLYFVIIGLILDKCIGN